MGAGDDSEGEEAASALEEELSVCDEAAPARALAALNALRKSRQHYDVLLLAGGAEVPAHRAVLAAASPYLLEALSAPPPAASGAAPAYRVDDVEPDALKELVEYAYTGRLRVRSSSDARRLYVAAWRLRVEGVRAALAARLLRRRAPADCLPLRALPDLEPHHRADLDAYIAQNFEELCSMGALGSLPEVRLEMLRTSSAEGGEETPVALANAALAWLQGFQGDLEELCSRPHLLFVDSGGALRDCGELPELLGDAPELARYRRAAAVRRARPAAPAAPLPALQLGARAARVADCAVVAAKQLATGDARNTRALVSVRGQLFVARISWTDVAETARGGVLGGARAEAEGERRARLPHRRCAHGLATLRGRLIACGGYDRARVLQDAVAYDPTTNTWTELPNMRSARARFPAARLGDEVYVIGGSDGHAELDSVDVWSAHGGWRGAARLPLARSHAAAAADEARGELFVVGGWAGGRSLRAVHKYSPGADAWTEVAPLNTGRSQCAAVWWRAALWALGGCDAWHCVASCEWLAAGAWRAGAPLPTPRRSVGGAVWRGRLVSVGGSDGAASLRHTDWLEAGGAWAAGPALRRARAALGVGVLGGVLYAAGGFDGKEFLSCVECLYEPDGEWSTLCSPPPVPRAPAARTPATPPAAGEHQESEENGVAAQ
ncbi:influenza virus NS1A-binding protein homolog B isoform X2 [Amyelois transitella]|uniref:influenza virus NS1A-binding protein homolog B isoform X2 n=1 Tax=Amyelois transitella TaxID=680683 RepID=UPI0029900801|nr:influenza virus NS1A-binding protein homolog B isoform X2 [Amyelois transitella]